MKESAIKIFEAKSLLEDKLGKITMMAIVRRKSSPRYWDILIHPDLKPTNELAYTKKFISAVSKYLKKDLSAISKIVILNDNDKFYKDFEKVMNDESFHEFRNIIVHGIPFSEAFALRTKKYTFDSENENRLVVKKGYTKQNKHK